MSALSPQELSYAIRHDIFQAVVVESLMVGMYTSIVLFTLYKIVNERGAKHMLRPLIILTLVMYGCIVVHLATRWRFAKEAYVDKGQSELSTLMAISREGKATVIISRVTRGATMLIADGIMIWRCWILFGHSWAVIALPIALILGELGSLIAQIVINLTSGAVGTTPRVLMLRLVHHSFTLAATVLVTLLIVYRIIRMGGVKRYRNVIEIIVESSALYAIAIIIYMPFPLSSRMFDMIPNAVLTPLPGITSTLIIARVTLDQGVEHTFDEKDISDEGLPAARTKVSTLRFRSTVGGRMDEEASTGLGANSVFDSDLQTSKDNTLGDSLNRSGSLRSVSVGEFKEK